jgi:hypothetical protein
MTAAAQTTLRRRLKAGGYSPLPLNGKAPSSVRGWQAKLDVTDDEIALWERLYPYDTNTGMLTKYTPTIDLDIVIEEAAEAIEELAREHFEERGPVLVRSGKAPKRAIPLRTDEPFDKMIASYIAPDGSTQKIEILGDGQQVVVDGVHPDTKLPYRWHGGEPWSVPREELPYVREGDMRAFLADAGKLLVEQFGCKPAAEERSKKKEIGNGAVDSAGAADWGYLLDNIHAGRELHDSLRDLSAKFVASGMGTGAAINALRGAMDKCTAPHDDRWKARYDDIPRLVEGAGRLPEDRPDGGKAFGFSWCWQWHGAVDQVIERRWLVQDILPETGAGLISGQWGTLKTFIAFNLAGAVMTGTDFIRYPVRRRGGVLFFACEGQSEVAIRLTALVEAHGMDKAPFAWVDDAPPLRDPNAANILAAMVKQAEQKMLAEFNLPAALVIIDTVGAAAGFNKSGEENDAALNKMVMRALGTASAKTGVLFLAVDHFGKTAEVGTRGSSAKEDNADVVLAVLGERQINGTVNGSRLTVRKLRSGETGAEFPFRSRVVDLGPDKYGAPITTLLIDWIARAAQPGGAKEKPDAWTKSLRLLRQVLMNILVDQGSEQHPYPDGPIVRAVDIEAVRAEFYRCHAPADGDARARQAARRQAFNRAIKGAQEKQLIGVREIGQVTYVWLAKVETHTAGAYQEEGSDGP